MGDSANAAHHLTVEELETGLDHIRQSPADGGPLRMIVQRPDVDARVVAAEGKLDIATGLVGDGWKDRGSTRTPDGGPNPAAQVTIMNSRVLALLAESEDRWPLAGDQLVIDIDMSTENLPPGARLSIGAAVIEISEEPHTGCAKFSQRFGDAALRFISTPMGRQLRLRGINTRVVRSGAIRVGDVQRSSGRRPAAAYPRIGPFVQKATGNDLKASSSLAEGRCTVVPTTSVLGTTLTDAISADALNLGAQGNVPSAAPPPAS